MNIFPIQRFTVNGDSMFPTLKEGQDVLSLNWFFKPKVGDIIVLKYGGKEMVKRVEKIDDQEVFVVGDNEAESTDSRDFGTVNMDKIVGKVVYQGKILNQVQDDRMIDCPSCSSPVIGIYGRKDAICSNCGFKLACCGEP